jgi:pimeloyl-ACP methyl ester carboxylesterase
LPEHLIKVGDRMLSAVAEGSGDIGVVLESGAGAPGESWQPIQSRLASDSTVWRYDRAGLGASGAAQTPRSADDLVEDLHAVVAVVPATRVVLVGHSLGGAIVRLYAHRHPNRIAGLVLVDSMHAHQFDRIGSLMHPASVLPAEAQDFHAFSAGGWRDPAQNAEGVDLLSVTSALHEVTSLGDLPLVVLAAGAFFLQLTPPPMNARLHEAWVAMQTELASLSTAGKLVRVDDSGHDIQQDRPEVVAGAIVEVLEASA